jgi:hypothetical protein
MEQYIFQKDYVEELKKSVKEGNVKGYGQQEFTYNKDAAFSINIKRDDLLLENMLKHATPGEDYDAAIYLFEAFSDLNREQACYEPFWVYLSHVDLYPYMIKRFCNGSTPTLTDIRINWWHSNLMRRGLSNLWWSVKQTIEEGESSPEKRYHYTKYFFKRLDFRQRRLGSSTLFRHREAVIGILKYLEENIEEHFEGRSNFIMMYFNKQATLKQLASCDRSYFYNELCSISDDIMKVKDRTEASGVLSSKDEDSWDE